MFDQLANAPVDPILGPVRLFQADPSPDKVDLGIGIYMNEQGEAAVLKTVKSAEQWLTRTQASKRYLSSGGNDDFNRLTAKLILGDIAGERVRTAQTPGGTGALRVAAEFLRTQHPNGRIFLPSPTWPNHPAIFEAVGYEVVGYPYYDLERSALHWDAMMACFAELRRGDIVLLHGCCHNPTGSDPTAAQWREIADILEKTGAIPLVDLAYQGFGDGLDQDATGVRMLAERLPEIFIASSYSKNFALYRERVGALTLVGRNEVEVERAHGHLMPIARTLYSMPPDHGAAVVAHILDDAVLRPEWEGELGTMRDRINGMRNLLAGRLGAAGLDRFDFMVPQRGMFVLLGLSQEAVDALRVEHHIHVGPWGRANIAGLNAENVDRVAAAIAAVCR